MKNNREKPADYNFILSCLAPWTNQRTKELGLTFRILMHLKYLNANRNVKEKPTLVLDTKLKNINGGNFKFHLAIALQLLRLR